MDKIRTYNIMGGKDDVKVIDAVVSKYLKRSESPDVLFVVGGDGVILDPQIKAEAVKTPVLRVHYRSNSLKSLGFAADVNRANLRKAIADLKNGNYVFETVKLLKCQLKDGHIKRELGSALVDLSLEGYARGTNILFKTVIKRPDRRVEKLPTPKCTGVVITGYYGSPAWNLSLNGPVVVDPELQCFLIDVREAPLKPDKFVVSGDDVICIKVFNDCVLKIDRAEHVIKKGQTLIVSTEDKPPYFVRFVKTQNTREPLMDKLLRFNRYQYGKIREGGNR
jgi:NAD kinase